YNTLPTAGLYLSTATASMDKLVKIDQYFTDAAAGTLPAFSIVDTNFDEESEENPQDLSRGEAFAANVINAAMHGPAWDKTLLIWTYDEHGGYYHHVPSPAAPAPDSIPPMLPPGSFPGDFTRYGIRVPGVIVSP